MDTNSTGSRVLVLAGFVGAAFLAAAPAGLWPPGEWYLALNKPSWNPPAWIFGPVWSALYLMMGIAAWRVWGTRHEQRTTALGLWWIQLALNALWTPLFFGAHLLGLAFIEIIVLLVFIVATTRSFRQVDTLAGVLLLPYVAWVSFAAYLNFTLWQLNH